MLPFFVDRDHVTVKLVNVCHLFLQSAELMDLVADPSDEQSLHKTL